MSHKKWGQFLTSRPTIFEARRTIIDFNKFLAHMSLPEEVKMGVIFEIHPCYDNVRGRNWHWGIYVKVDEDAAAALSLLQHSRSKS